MSFQYRQLKDNEIRLLKPLPHSSGLLCYRIVYVSLASEPRYAALSYTWGSPGDTHHILLNGQRFPIRHNLHDALDQISSLKLVNRYLWVDAICINQGQDAKALSERSTQVQLMKEIYEQARKVFVWLGKPDSLANNRQAFLLMRKLEKRFQQGMVKTRPYWPWWWPTDPRTQENKTVVDFMLTTSSTRDKATFDLPGSPTHTGWLGIVSLWSSPWWTRTWIYPEATVPEPYPTYYAYGIRLPRPQEKVRFLCGDQQTTWAELTVARVVAVSLLSTPGLDSRFLVSTQDAFTNIEGFRAMRVRHVPTPFLDVLQAFRHTTCSDPRDKVYAPLSLASADIRRSIIPDYATKTVLGAHIDVARYCLAKPGHSLDFLGYTMFQHKTQIAETPQGIISTFPTWVPNFSASLEITPMPKSLFVPEKPRRKSLIDRHGVPTKTETQVAAYRPLGDIYSSPFIEGATLFVRGACIDTLEDKIVNTGPDVEALKAVCRTTSSRWAADLSYHYFTGESYVDACKRTMLLDVAYDPTGRPSKRGNSYDEVLMRKPQTELTPTEYRHQLAMKGAQKNAFTLRDMGLSQKQYLLLIPNTAVVGDTIWALAGGQVLYVLRPVNRELGQYMFVGECYGHGLMDGEIVRQIHLGETKMEDISLI